MGTRRPLSRVRGERQSSSGCGLHDLSLKLPPCRAAGAPLMASLAPRGPSPAAIGGLRGSRLRGLATALSLRSEARRRRGRARAVRLSGGFGRSGDACVLSTPSSSRGAMAATSSCYGDVSEWEVLDCLEHVLDRSVCREVPFCDTLRTMWKLSAVRSRVDLEQFGYDLCGGAVFSSSIGHPAAVTLGSTGRASNMTITG